MKIVLTHHNPDFDAMASGYAAMKLHKCDLFVMCSSPESNVRKFIEENDFEIPITNLSSKSLPKFEHDIDLVVITDCKLLNRLGILKTLVMKSKKVIVYDHHPINDDDIAPDELYLEEVGSSTTILVEKLVDKKVVLSTMEATFLLLGIYEDTGFLSFSSTKPKDLLMAAKLLEEGASISATSEYIKREMNRQHIFLLNELLMNMTLYSVQGLHIGISYGSSDEYLTDISLLAHRIVDIENLDALFIAVRSGYRIVVVGRSKVDDVNAALIMESMGGGGHPTASSSIVKDMTLNETFDKLLSLTKEHIKPIRHVSEFMTTPVKYVKSTHNFDEASNEFMKYNLNMLPVVEDGHTLGLIARKDILQGLKHGLSSESVSSIMQIEFETAEPSMPFFEVEDIMLSKNQKLVPVETDGKLVGVVTRTDLLRLMREEIVRTPKYMSRRIAMGHSRFRNVKNLLNDRMPDKYFKMLIEIGKLAEKKDMSAHVVGGFVRDIIMRNSNFDIDIVVEGDAIVLANEYAKQIGAKVSFHHKFKTAVVMMKDGFKVDFATSRTEYYTVPAAAPEVENSSIKNDLYRRDFTINAMSVRLNSSYFGEILDFFGGQKDIKDKKIRVLHNLSFVDDPSRCFRAIRFAVRYGFEIGPHTHKLLKHAVSLELFDRVLGSRLFSELKYILSEVRYLDGIEKLCEYNMLKFFSSKIQMTDEKLKHFNILDRISSWYLVQCGEAFEIWKCRFGIMFYELKFRDIVSLANRLDFSTGLKKELTKSFLKTKSIALKIRRKKDLTPYYIYESFHDLADEYVIFAGVLLGEDYEYMIKDYFTKIQKIEIEISGADLISLGYKPSKKFGEVLKEVFKLKINGKIASRDEEMKAAVKLFGEI